MQDGRLINTVVYGMVDGKDRGNRPTKRWVDGMKQWAKEPLHLIHRRAQYRAEWRSYVANIIGTNGHGAHGHFFSGLC